VRQPHVSVNAAMLPESVVRYVMRTRNDVILDDARAENPFSGDVYIVQHHARSVLCFPLTNQAKLIGLLYLENNLTPHVFTPARITVLRLLASRAAISLDNARLYNDIREREAKIRRLVESNIIGIVIWSVEGQIIDANEAFLRMVGYEREDLLSGLSWRKLTPDEWQASNERALAEIAATGICETFEKEFFRKDGSRVPVLAGGALFEGSGNEGVAFVLDLTERKRAEEALRQVQTDLAHVSRVTTLGALTTSIAHEVNQPLGAIVNYGNASLRLLSGGLENFEEVKHAIAKIIEDANRASAIIAHARALSKKSPPEKGTLNIRELINEVMALTRHELDARSITVHVQFAEKLPFVLGDRIQIQQVLLNLVMNGIEAMSAIAARDRTLTVRVCLHEVDDQHGVRVCIQDAGVGLQMDQSRLFEAFYTTKPSGLGMGLAISRSIVEAHGGKLWAEPNDGPGATFCFVLPMELPKET